MSDKSYIIIEQIDSSFRKTNAVLEDKNTTLTIQSIEEAQSYESFKKPTIKADNVLLALNSDNASTIQKVITLKRENPKAELTKEEVDKLVFKALWEFLNTYRSWSFQKMGVTDLDMVLAGIFVSGVSLDERKVLDPTGLKGKKLTLNLTGTFIPRSMLSLAEHVGEFGKSIKVVERFAISSLFIQKTSGYAFHLDRSNAYAFALNESEIKFHKKYDIGINDFIEPIVSSLEIERWEAEEILYRYFQENLSKKATSFITEKTRNQFERIEKITKQLAGKKKTVFCNMPKAFYAKLFKSTSRREYIDFQKILETKEFNVIMNEDTRPLFDEQSYLALSSYPIGSHHYQRINTLLEKRSKWLVPSDTNK